MNGDAIKRLEEKRARPAWVEVDVSEAVMARVGSRARGGATEGSPPLAMAIAALPVALASAAWGIWSWAEVSDPLVATLKAMMPGWVE